MSQSQTLDELFEQSLESIKLRLKDKVLMAQSKKEMLEEKATYSSQEND
jgi:hypothetical protein